LALNFHSTFILAAVLLVGLAAPLLGCLPVVLQNLAICRGLSYGLLTDLTLRQLWTVDCGADPRAPPAKSPPKPAGTKLCA